MKLFSRARVRTSVEAVIIRADGTRENLGCIAYADTSLVGQLKWNLRKWARRVGLLRKAEGSPITGEGS